MEISLIVAILAAVAAFLVGGAIAFGTRWPILGAIPRSGFKTRRLAMAALLWIAGLMLIGSLAQPFFAFFASCLLGIAGLLVAATQGARLSSWLIGGTMVVLAAVTAFQRPLGLRVMMLPTADELPERLAPATILKTFARGQGLESVRMGADGTIYMAGTADIDPALTDYYRHAYGFIVARKPDGNEREIFRTPRGHTGQVMAIASDNTIYMTGDGIDGGVWKIAPDGVGNLFTDMPEDAWPNGIDFGPDGQLYSADSRLGVIWRIDPVTGRSAVAIRDEALTRRNSITLAPGANGLRFRGQDMFVAVSDRAHVLRYRLAADGRFSAAKVVATGIPGDDLAIGPDGALFVTTHVYDTLVRVAQNGERTVVGGVGNGVTGSTDASFGVLPEDERTLYVATDGGRFSTAGATARGQLIAVRPY
ncbi:MAG: hypothetical protein RL481_1840 [Pseudomonadota bacterium]|jgi:sugar lactone lactonase YvrE